MFSIVQYTLAANTDLSWNTEFVSFRKRNGSVKKKKSQYKISVIGYSRTEQAWKLLSIQLCSPDTTCCQQTMPGLVVPQRLLTHKLKCCFSLLILHWKKLPTKNCYNSTCLFTLDIVKGKGFLCLFAGDRCSQRHKISICPSLCLSHCHECDISGTIQSRINFQFKIS